MSIIEAKLSKRSDISNWGQIVQNWYIIVRIKYNDYIYYLKQNLSQNEAKMARFVDSRWLDKKLFVLRASSIPLESFFTEPWLSRLPFVEGKLKFISDLQFPRPSPGVHNIRILGFGDLDLKIREIVVFWGAWHQDFRFPPKNNGE